MHSKVKAISNVHARISIPDFGVDFYRTHFFVKIGFAYISNFKTLNM